MGRAVAFAAPFVAALVAVGQVQLPPSANLLRLVLSLPLALLVVYRAAVREMGYAPVAAGAVGDADLVHDSRRTVAELDPTGAGIVDLSPAYCAFLCRMLRRDLFWPRRAVRAVYFFAGEPPRAARAARVTGARTRVVVDVTLVRGPVFQRFDGSIALPGGYRGPARFEDREPAGG